MAWTPDQSDRPCPFVELDDCRCSAKLSLQRLDQAFNYCFGGYLRCPTYQQLRWERQTLSLANPTAKTHGSSPVKLVPLTIRRRAAIPLRPTGT